MKKQFILLVIVLNLVVFSSCNKDNNINIITPKTNTELLTQSTWKFKSATVGGSDAAGLIQACQKDNILTFAATGSGNADEGTTKCDPADPQTISFSWNFETSETILFISTVLFTGGSNRFNIVSLSETELVVSQGISPGPGPIQMVVVTFIH